MSDASFHKNRLVNAASPYLRQHANNPVEWYPWSPEALECARKENKPILLSIGYAACHWCHVMAHESFEDVETAKLMNQHFINIKVDREERPDLDKIYQMAHQLFTGRGGGWPLTVFLSPQDLTPFFAGTYFPKNPGYGLPTFKELLQTVSDYYKNHPAEINLQNKEFHAILTQIVADHSKPNQLDLNPWAHARHQLESLFDANEGGFGQAPKFPHPNFLQFLLYHWQQSLEQGTNDEFSLKIITTTLNKMAEGGIYDQLRGGFFRYAIDEEWQIPHFEKMLYDNGQLLTLYTDAYRATQNPYYAQIANATADWVLEEMAAPDGGYYASLDADSEGQEGKAYIWDIAELKQQLTSDEFAICEAYFGLHQKPNFEGYFHLHALLPLEQVAAQIKFPLAKTTKLFIQAQSKLLKTRKKRPQPLRDDKILTSWNALMVKGMAIAGYYLNRPDLLASAVQTLDFIRDNLFKNNQLYAAYAKNSAYLDAYLDDYAFLLDALLTLLQLAFRPQDLNFAKKLADHLIQDFFDVDPGGFFFTSNHHEKLVFRPKALEDEAMPAGYAIAISVLLRLGYLINDDRYLNAAEKSLYAAWDQINQYPTTFCSILLGLREWLIPPQIIILKGKQNALKKWKTATLMGFHPARICVTLEDKFAQAPDLPDSWKQYPKLNDTHAYVCEGRRCYGPIETLEELNHVIS